VDRRLPVSWRNIRKILLKYMALHCKRQHSSLNTWQFRDFLSVVEEIGLHFRNYLRIRDRLKLHCSDSPPSSGTEHNSVSEVISFSHHHRVKENSTFWRWPLSPSAPHDDKVSQKQWNYLLYRNSRWTIEISLQKTYNFISNKWTK
jgi:hypothetical protein